jgi:glycosyltransferase involved in cell wall biosynthesis
MTISVVTPCLNQGRFLREALESVRRQSYPCVEHLVLDGGSTDETLPILESLAETNDWSHVHWSSGPDGGQSDALNRVFAQAKGDIIGWLNSDDRYRPGCFDHVVQAFADHPEIDILYGDYTLIGEDGEFLQTRREIEFDPFILLYHRVLYIATTATFFRRRIFEEGNWLRSDLHYAMDYEFFLRLAGAGYRIAHMPHLIADFRLHPQSKSCSMTQVQLREKQNIMRSFSSVPGRSEAVLLSLQVAAALMRWSQKMMRGHYLVQYLGTPQEDE